MEEVPYSIRYIAAGHGVTGTYDRAAQSIKTFGTLGISGGRGEESVIATLTTLCFLIPRHGGSQVSCSSTLSGKEQWRAALT